MNRHPGGEEQTLHLLKSIELKKGMKALDLGAGEGETVRIMKAFGLNVQGVILLRETVRCRGEIFWTFSMRQTVWISVSASVHFLSAEIRKRQFLNAGVY